MMHWDNDDLTWAGSGPDNSAIIDEIVESTLTLKEHQRHISALESRERSSAEQAELELLRGKVKILEQRIATQRALSEPVGQPIDWGQPTIGNY